MMIVSNITKKNIICHNCFVANTFRSRFKGLLGRSGMTEGEGLLIIPCRSVHTFGMRFSIDLVFLANDGRVVELVCELAPGRLSQLCRDAVMVLELAAGRIAGRGIEIGDQIKFDK